MISYLAKVKQYTMKLRGFEVELIPWNQNTQVDKLSKLASSTLSELNKSVNLEGPTTLYIVSEASWMDPIMTYKLTGELPEDKNATSKLKTIASGERRQFGIKLAYSAVFNPRINGQAEAVNKQILGSLREKCDNQKTRWLEEIPGTL
ncbi:Uncharacterized protein RDABS01_039977 [Bienertia sinuspersici]